MLLWCCELTNSDSSFSFRTMHLRITRMRQFSRCIRSSYQQESRLRNSPDLNPVDCVILFIEYTRTSKHKAPDKLYNAHNTVFGSKRPAICALAVYFMHSTRLVSRDSIVDRHWLPATDCCQRYLPCWRPAFDVADNLGRFLHGVYRPGNDFELIPTVKMEIRHPVEGSFGNKFCRSIVHCAVIAAWSRKTWKINFIFTFFFWNTGKFSKFCSEGIHRDIDRRVVFKFREILSTANR